MNTKIEVVKLLDNDVIATSAISLKFTVSGIGDDTPDNFALKLNGTGDNLASDYASYNLYIGDVAQSIDNAKNDDSNDGIMIGSIKMSSSVSSSYNGQYTFDGTKFIHD